MTGATDTFEDRTSAVAWLTAHGQPGDVARLAAMLQAGNRTGDEVVDYLYGSSGEGDDYVAGGDDCTLSLAFALACNLDDEWVVEQLLALQVVGGSYRLGGGAAPELTVRRTL